MDNGALAQVVDRARRVRGVPEHTATAIQETRRPCAFDAMNDAVANVLANVTASSRFGGPLNADLSETAQNLVPFPRLHFLVPSLAPLYSLRDGKCPERLDSVFSEVFGARNALVRVDLRRATCLACGCFLRGGISVADARRNLVRVRPQLRMTDWNPEGFKVSICAAAPVGHPHALLALQNSCCFGAVLREILCRFDRLYRRRAHLHHFAEFMETTDIDAMRETLAAVAYDYTTLESPTPR